jgi:hypothetical protein
MAVLLAVGQVQVTHIQVVLNIDVLNIGDVREKVVQT